MRDAIKRSRRRGIPRVNGVSSKLRIRRERCSNLSCSVSAVDFSAVIIAVMYFRKSTPHCSQVPPCRCSCLHAGHRYRNVAWHRWQKRATSRTSFPHFGHCMVSLFYRRSCAARCLRRPHVLFKSLSWGSVAYRAARTGSLTLSAMPAFLAASAGIPSNDFDCENVVVEVGIIFPEKNAWRAASNASMVLLPLFTISSQI